MRVTFGEAATDTGGRDARAAGHPWRTELGLVAALYLGYSAARFLFHVDRGAALEHARALLGLERAMHLAVEGRVNALLSAWQPVAVVASYWYAVPHYIVTPVVLGWAYRRRAGQYRRVRNALLSASAAGLVCFALLPMAPPRMLPGFVDTLAVTSPYGWWSGDASAPRGLGGLTNEFAAMPSLHVGWALWVAWVGGTLARRRWVRVVAALYPVATTVVVLGTANHFLLDAVAGAVVIAGGIRLSTMDAGTARRNSRHRHPLGPQFTASEGKESDRVDRDRPPERPTSTISATSQSNPTDLTDLWRTHDQHQPPTRGSCHDGRPRGFHDDVRRARCVRP